MKLYVYILRSLKDGKHYVGMSSNVDKRLARHNAGGVSSTKHRKPFVLIYSEEFLGRVDAREREKHLKSYKGSREKMEIIERMK